MSVRDICTICGRGHAAQDCTNPMAAFIGGGLVYRSRTSNPKNSKSPAKNASQNGDSSEQKNSEDAPSKLTNVTANPRAGRSSLPTGDKADFAITKAKLKAQKARYEAEFWLAYKERKEFLTTWGSVPNRPDDIAAMGRELRKRTHLAASQWAAMGDEIKDIDRRLRELGVRSQWFNKVISDHNGRL